MHMSNSVRFLKCCETIEEMVDAFHIACSELENVCHLSALNVTTQRIHESVSEGGCRSVTKADGGGGGGGGGGRTFLMVL